MALTHGRLADIQFIASSAAAVYTNAASATTYIRSIILFNGNTTAELVKLYLVPDSGGSAGTAAAGNQISQISLSPNETLFLGFAGPGLILEDTNDTLQGSTTTASKVTIYLVGDKDA